MGRGPDPRNNDVRALLVRSGNLCAFPGCDQRVVSDRNDFIAQICHICGASPEGPRYRVEQTEEERRTCANLIILCYPHHVEVDNHPDEFTVERLLNMKKAHETRVNEFTPSPQAVLQAILEPSVVHSFPPDWLSALASRAAFRCLPLVAGGPEPFKSLGARTYLATALIGIGVLAYAMTVDPQGSARRVANIARLIAYGAAGKLTPNAPPPGAIDAATSIVRANVAASLAAIGHYGTSIDARAGMLCSIKAMPDALDQLRSDLATATAPRGMDVSTFLLSPLWDPGSPEPWRASLDAFVKAIETMGGATPELRTQLASTLVKLTAGALSRAELDSCAHAWANSENIQSRLRAEDEANRR